MTQVKSKKNQESNVIMSCHGEPYQAPAAKIDPIDLRAMFKHLDPKDQEAVINFFNLHNAAIWIYSNLSQAAKDYANFSIKLSQEKIEDV